MKQIMLTIKISKINSLMPSSNMRLKKLKREKVRVKRGKSTILIPNNNSSTQTNLVIKINYLLRIAIIYHSIKQTKTFINKPYRHSKSKMGNLCIRLEYIGHTLLN